MNKKVLLCILDGWGVAEKSHLMQFQKQNENFDEIVKF